MQGKEVDFGTAIEKIRRQKGLGQRELARMAGLHSGSIDAIENQKHMPGADRLMAIAKA